MGRFWEDIQNVCSYCTLYLIWLDVQVVQLHLVVFWYNDIIWYNIWIYVYLCWWYMYIVGKIIFLACSMWQHSQCYFWTWVETRQLMKTSLVTCQTIIYVNRLNWQLWTPSETPSNFEGRGFNWNELIPCGKLTIRHRKSHRFDGI